MKSFSEHVAATGSPMRVFVAIPDGAGPFPGVVVIQHQAGLDEFTEDMTRRFAADGYAAAAPDLYHRDGPDCKDDRQTRRSRLRDQTVIEDVEAAAEFLKKHPSVDGANLGIVGFCMGGRVSYLMASAGPSFKAAVVYYGGNIMRAWGDGPSAFERTRDIHCPLLGHFGEDDKNPSPEDMRKLDAELTSYGKVHDFYSYANTGHAFMNRFEESYRPHADQASWPRTLDFLARYLRKDTSQAAAAH